MDEIRPFDCCAKSSSSWRPWTSQATTGWKFLSTADFIHFWGEKIKVSKRKVVCERSELFSSLLYFIIVHLWNLCAVSYEWKFYFEKIVFPRFAHGQRQFLNGDKNEILLASLTLAVKMSWPKLSKMTWFYVPWCPVLLNITVLNGHSLLRGAPL